MTMRSCRRKICRALRGIPLPVRSRLARIAVRRGGNDADVHYLAGAYQNGDLDGLLRAHPKLGVRVEYRDAACESCAWYTVLHSVTWGDRVIWGGAQ